MPETIFVAASEPGCGKTILSIGMVVSLRKMVEKVGYIKIIGHRIDKQTGVDEDVLVISEILNNGDSLHDMCPTNFQEIRNNVLDGKKDKTIKKIVAAYKKIAAGKDVVIVEGTDHTEMSSNMELNINADVAMAIGCKVLLVAKGRNKSEEVILSDVETARSSYVEKGCRILGAVISNVPADQYENINRSLRDRLTLREIPLVGIVPSSDLLPHPRLRDLIKHMDIPVEVLHGEENLDNIAHSFIVGSMQPRNAVKYFSNGCVVVTAGDRDDLILAVIATHMAEGFPNIAGIVLTGGLKPPATIQKIINSLDAFTTPVLSVDLDTYSAITRIKNIDVHIEPGDKQKINEAAFLVEGHVNVAEIFELSHVTTARRRTPEDFLNFLELRASTLGKHIVFPEGTEQRIIQAAGEIIARQIARITLLGPEEEIKTKARRLGVSLTGIDVIDPLLEQGRFKDYARIFFEKRKHKGITENMAADQIHDSIYYGTVMVEAGDADGLVSGSVHSTANTIRPALQIIKTPEGINTVSSVFFMLKGSKIFLYGDCAIVENPDAGQLCDIAVSSIMTATAFNVPPYVAMLSFSTGDSGTGPMVEKVKQAVAAAKARVPDIPIEGPMQYDAAFDPEVAKVKYPDSKVAGKANVFIFPDLNSGNIAYKAVQREAGAIALGPILQGLRKPVNDLSRGCNIQDIIYVTAITAIQASILG